MEYEEDGPGSVPDFGAIFMSNTETKVECFRQNILALPPSYANFVKKVKEGMVLFLFEFERRQLFGVFKAVSDGGMNISRSPFRFSGRHFPAQVRFTTIWKCPPLCENDFREAIRENYFTPKMFNFGLSQVQVSDLLQLFDSRRLPPKQLGIDTRVNRSAGNDQRRISIRERVKTRDFEDYSSQMEMREISPSFPHTAIEDNDNMLFVDDRVNTGKSVNFSRENCLNEQFEDSLCQRERMCDDVADTGFYDPDAPALSYRTGDHDVTLGKERVLNTCSPMDGVSEHGFNVYAGVGSKYSKVSLDVNRRTDYERTEFGSPNSQLFDWIESMKSRLNSRGAIGRAISDELDDVHKKPERMTSFGHNCNMDDDNVNPMTPSKIYDDSQHFINKTSGRSKPMMDKGMGAQQNLDTGLGFDLVSNFGQRINDERRFTSGSEIMNANGIGGIHSSTSYNPSEHRKADFPNSLDHFGPAYLDSGSFQLEGLQNIQTSNSAYHDSVFARTSAPECPATCRHSPSTIVINQGAGSDHRYYHIGGNSLSPTERKLHDGELRDRFDSSAPARRDLEHPYAVSQCPELRPPALTLDISLPFTSPSTHGCAPFTDYENFCPKRVSPLSSKNQNRTYLHKSDIHWQEIGQRNSGDEVLPSITNSTTHFGYHGEKYLTSDDHWQGIAQRNSGDEVLPSITNSTTHFGYHGDKYLTSDQSKLYSKRPVNDDGQHLSPGGDYPDSHRQRRSVFSRMGRTARAQTEDESEKHDPYLNASVEETMEMLTSHQNVRSRDNRKSKPVVRQHGQDERVRIDVQASPEPAKRFLATPMKNATSTVFVEVNEFPVETREVGFKRRRNLLAGNTPKTSVQNTSIVNAVSEGPVHKPQKRRKLSRPNFGSGASVEAVGNS